MIIIGEPDNVTAYYMCDGVEALELQKHGFSPKYIGNDGTLYFKLNAKLNKYLKANNGY